MSEFGKNKRVRIVSGPHAGETGRVVRAAGRGAVYVKRDSRISMDEIAIKDLEEE